VCPTSVLPRKLRAAELKRLIVAGEKVVLLTAHGVGGTSTEARIGDKPVARDSGPCDGPSRMKVLDGMRLQLRELSEFMSDGEPGLGTWNAVFAATRKR
jgi:hypothetical protein